MSLLSKILEDNGLKAEVTTTEETTTTDANNSNTEDTTGTGGEAAVDTTDDSSGAAGAAGAGEGSEVDDIDDTRLLEALKKKGLSFNSLDELRKPAEAAPEKPAEPTNEDIAAAARQYALDNKLVTPEKLEGYTRDKGLLSQEEEFARQLYRQERLAELRTAGTAEADLPSTEDLDEEFTDAHYLYMDDKDPRKKHGLKNIKRMVSDYMKSNYSDLEGLEEVYTRHQQGTQQRQQYDQVLTETVTDLTAGLNFTIKDGDTEHQYSFKPRPEMISQMQQLYQNDETFSMLGQGKGVTKDVVLNAARNSLIAANLNEIIEEVTKAHTAKVLADQGKGRRAIPTIAGGGKRVEPDGNSGTSMISKAVQKNTKK